jgi:hypothetical protein
MFKTGHFHSGPVPTSKSSTVPNLAPNQAAAASPGLRAPLDKILENRDARFLAGPKKRLLDFMIIGSGKSGTTSLHRYLQGHPQLYLLPEKEVPFFTNADYLARGWDWYVGEFFSQAPPDKLWGKTTPQYLVTPETPAKIHRQMPQAKLIALLRNPIERTYSNYKMMVKRRNEDRPFLDVVKAKLQEPASPEHGWVNEKESYVYAAEYGRLLDGYLKIFPREQLLVLFTEDLKQRPAEVLRRILQFLGVDDAYTPPNLGKQYHVGGTQRRIPLDEHALARHRWFRRALKLFPHNSRDMVARRFLFWYMIWNTRPDSPDKQMPAEARVRLARFYREDVASLKRLLHRDVPWPEFASV